MSWVVVEKCRSIFIHGENICVSIYVLIAYMQFIGTYLKRVSWVLFDL